VVRRPADIGHASVDMSGKSILADLIQANYTKPQQQQQLADGLSVKTAIQVEESAAVASITEKCKRRLFVERLEGLRDYINEW
jgi:hypothetical protein